MNCKYCKGSGKLLLLNKYVECDCKANPALKWADCFIKPLSTNVALSTPMWFSPVCTPQYWGKERPATDEDVADMQKQMEQVCNDPNLTFVTRFIGDE